MGPVHQASAKSHQRSIQIDVHRLFRLEVNGLRRWSMADQMESGVFQNRLISSQGRKSDHFNDIARNQSVSLVRLDIDIVGRILQEDPVTGALESDRSAQFDSVARTCIRRKLHQAGDGTGGSQEWIGRRRDFDPDFLKTRNEKQYAKHLAPGIESRSACPAKVHLGVNQLRRIELALRRNQSCQPSIFHGDVELQELIEPPHGTHNALHLDPLAILTRGRHLVPRDTAGRRHGRPAHHFPLWFGNLRSKIWGRGDAFEVQKLAWESNQMGSPKVDPDPSRRVLDKQIGLRGFEVSHHAADMNGIPELGLIAREMADLLDTGKQRQPWPSRWRSLTPRNEGSKR